MVKKGDEDIDCEYWRSELFKTKSVNLKERNIRYEFLFYFIIITNTVNAFNI